MGHLLQEKTHVGKTSLIINAHFASLPDPRTGNATPHELLDIVTVTICAILCGADSWTEVEVWGQAK